MTSKLPAAGNSRARRVCRDNSLSNMNLDSYLYLQKDQDNETQTPTVVKKAKYQCNKEKKRRNMLMSSDYVAANEENTFIGLNEQVSQLTERCEMLEADNIKLLNLLYAKTKECDRAKLELAITRTSIFDLPFDCLLKIFIYVDNLELLENTCPSWKSLIDNHRKSFAEPSSFDIYKDRDSIKRKRNIFYLNEGDEPLLQCIVSPCARSVLEKETKSLAFNWYKQNWRYKPIRIRIVNDCKGMSIDRMMRNAIHNCPDWWLSGVKELRLDNCRLSDEWVFLLERLPHLEDFHMNFYRNNEKCWRKKARLPVSSLISALGSQINAICVLAFNYSGKEADLVSSLIKKSQQTTIGLRLVDIGSKFAVGKYGSRDVLCNPLPLQEIIKFIEEGKFSKTETVLLNFDLLNGNDHDELIAWMELRNIYQPGRDVSGNDEYERVVYNFKYRGSQFELAIFIWKIKST